MPGTVLDVLHVVFHVTLTNISELIFYPYFTAKETET